MEENNGGAFYAPDTRNWWQRLLSRLFPSKLHPDMADVDGMAPGYLITEVVARLSLIDRLRVLLSGGVVVAISTKTDVPVAKAYSTSVVWVEAP